MPTIDYTAKEVVFRVAACGPASVGKTLLLWRLHAQTPANERSELSIRPLVADQLVSFECTAHDLVPTGDYRAKLHIFTVPGRVSDPAIWQRVMNDVDGIIFVADSQYERIGESADALRELNTLRGIEGVPLVFIYNKRDLPNAAPVDYIDQVINSTEPRIPRFDGIISQGKGAAEALAALTKLMLARTAQKEEEPAPPAPTAPPEQNSTGEQPAIYFHRSDSAKESDVTLDGGCLCGQVRYRLYGLPCEVFHSHSIIHRRAHGAPLVTWVVCRGGDFELQAGELKEYIAEDCIRTFCPECGTPLTFRELAAEVLLIAAATLDTPELLSPTRHEAAADALPWPKVTDGLPRSL